MRRICVFLCLSLFVSLIHAGGMIPSTDLEGRLHTQLQHDCHTQSNSSVEKSQTSNHQSHYQCCVGVIANLSSNQYTQPDFSNHFISQVPQLIVEAVPSHIFKPPRIIS